MQHSVAKEIVEMMLRHFAELDASVALARDQCTETEFLEYRRVAGKLMGYLSHYGLEPMFEEHPDLMPESFRDTETD